MKSITRYWGVLQLIKLINISDERPSKQYKMWNFLEGIKPPDKKIKISETQKEDKKKSI